MCSNVSSFVPLPTPATVARSWPDGFDVNVRCLDDFGEDGFPMEIGDTIDGRNWEKVFATA